MSKTLSIRSIQTYPDISRHIQNKFLRGDAFSCPICQVASFLSWIKACFAQGLQGRCDSMPSKI